MCKNLFIIKWYGYLNYGKSINLTKLLSNNYGRFSILFKSNVKIAFK